MATVKCPSCGNPINLRKRSYCMREKRVGLDTDEYEVFKCVYNSLWFRLYK